MPGNPSARRESLQQPRTGRFADTSGQAALAGTTFLTGPAARTGFYELDGTLSYAASDRPT